MDDTKLCECLNNEAQIDSIIDGDSDITSEMQLESQVYSDLEKVVEVVDRYEGGTTRDIIVSVDNEADIITATLQKMWFLSVDEFPEVGSDNLIYADKGTGALYTYNSQSGEYEKLIDDIDLRSISINGEKVEIDENKNADIPKATSTQLGVVAVDGAVADDSENPVQNKVIKKYIDDTKTALDTSIADLDGKIGATDGKVENLKQALDTTNKTLSDTQNSVNLAHSEIEKTNTRVTSLENRATTTETNISNINNSIATINGEIASINISLDDKASLTEENSFTGKQNFNGEVEINAVVEANRSVNINNATLNIVDEANDKVTTVYSDRIVSTSGEGGATVEAKLPSKSGTLLTDNDNVAYKDEIPDVSEFITRAVNDLVNYYTKSQIDTTVSGLQAQISAIPKFAISVVTALPTTDISETTIYLLKTSTTETGNLYTEYIYINGSWESLGTQTLDLTGYAKESWVETKIADFLTTSQVNALISSALQEYSKTSEFSNIAFSGNLSDGTQDSTHRLVSDSEKAIWNAKQNALTFDEVPTANSDNPVKSKGIKTELDKKANTTDIPTVPTKVSAFENDANYATEQYVDENGGKIDTISVNSVAQAITNKNVNIEVPTKVSDLENDSGFLTEYTESDPTVPEWAKQPKKPTYDYSEITNTPTIPTGLELYDSIGDNTDGAMTQKATTEALGEKLTKNMFNTYVGTVDACSDTDGNFGQCANIYNNDGSLYAGRKFTFNKDDFQQDGTDDNKKYSLASDVVRTDDLTTAVSGVETKLATKVDKVEGKDLSTNDYTTVEKTKLAGLSNYDDTEVKGLISNEAETRQNAVDTLQGEIDSSNENISDLYNVVDKNVVTDATVAETTSQVNITLTKTNISSGATSTKTVSIPSATGSQAGLLSAEAQTIGGAKTFTGDITIGGNLNVTGTTTTVDSTTLQVKDKLIEVAHGNEVSLTTPAGLVAPKYNGTQDGALVFDNTGTAYVGDVQLNDNGDIDVENSDLQPLATRGDLVDGNLTQWDSTNNTLVDSGTSVSALNSNINSKQTQLSETQLNAVNSGITETKISTYDGYATTIDAKMDKENPTGTGSFSLNRKADTTIGNYSFAEGYLTTASGYYSHAEGYNTTASGYYSHAEGYLTTASGFFSHAEGYLTTASGSRSHAEGYLTTANSRSQRTFGEYNVLDTNTNPESNGTYVEIVGNGTSTSARSNARTLDWKGNEWLAGGITIGGKWNLSVNSSGDLVFSL